MSSLLKNKKGTVIHRTTSETLRLGDDILSSHNPVRISAAGTRKKSQVTSPNCSFQITGVSLTRYDIGDDSADDLDESHTDDNSRITDNETPSFSEDSRDTDDPQQLIYNATTTNLPQQQQQQQPVTIESETKNKYEKRKLEMGRFKVIKIQNAVPISRGRWTCFDYTDSSLKPDLLICDKQGNAQSSEIMQGTQKPALFEEDSSNRNNVDVEDKKRISNTSILWDNNCQESFVFSGSIVMPTMATTLFPIPIERPPRNKVKYHSTTSFEAIPSRYPLYRPIRSVIPQIIQPKFDEVITIEDGQNPQIKISDAHIEVADNLDTPSQELLPADPNSNSKASVSCTATIDTKIEHALDVVKNHLTHAVRMEVEELKIKINELVDRINYLEYENDVLRANVAPEVLANLDNVGEK